MPAIRVVYTDQQTRTTSEEWVRISDAHPDKDGYLQFFTITEGDGVTRAMHLVRHDVSQYEMAVAIFGAGTQVRSAKGLLEDFAKIARKQKWVGRAGAVGIGFASVAILAEFLQTRPFDKEGYYRADGTLFLPGKIAIGNRRQYDPRQSDR